MPELAPNRFEQPQNLSTYWCAVFVNELYRNGLRHAVISPGSRSTPLTLAFALHPHIHSQVVVDERSAGFVALGIAMKSREPAALVCTSGTAVANYLPSVVEAHMSGVPMLVLSADRPPNLRNIGANQAIRQNGIFGSYAVFEHDAGEPVNSANDFRRLEILASQAWEASISLAGAAHINFPFRKPLEPEADFRAELPAYFEKSLETNPDPVSRALKQTWSVPLQVTEQLSRVNRPIVIAGPMPQDGLLQKILDSFEKTGIPVLREAAAGLSHAEEHIVGFNAFLKDPLKRKELKPDLIIRLGAAPVGKGLELYLGELNGVPTIRFEMGSAWSDPFQNGGQRISVPPGPCELSPAALPVFTHTAWQQKWKDQSEAALNKRNNLAADKTNLRDGDVYSAVLKHTTLPQIFMISNSFAARDADHFAAPELLRHEVYMNRGASGIDGITSTAAGLALAGEKPVTLITGDLAFLHDTTALLTINQLPAGKRMRIIVVNNNGGSIFRMLPVYEPADWFTRFFETPQNVQLGALAKAFHIETSEANSHEELEICLKNDAAIQIIICNTHPDLSMKQREALWK